MSLTIFLVSMLFIFSISLAAVIFYMYAKRKSASGIGLVALLFLANFFYIFGYAMELASQSVTWKLVFNYMQYFGIPFIVPLWLMICVRFCIQDYRWTALKTVLLLIIPAVTLALNLTHCLNGIFYSSYTLEKWNGLTVLIFQKGIWYYAELYWRIALSAITIWLYARTLSRAKGIMRKQALVLLILSVFGFLLSGSSLFSASTSQVDFAVLLLSASSVLMFATLFKYELFELIPLAYSQLFNGTDQPVMVLADSMSVVKANEAAKKILPRLGKFRSYLSLNSLFPNNKGFESKLLKDEEQLVEIDQDDHKRFYSAKLTRLNIKQSAIKKDFGYLLVLSDVTSHINQVRDLEIEASTDPLTGLLNRRTFFTLAEKKLEEAVAEGTATSLIMIDIDHFKDVNDQYGHQAGDHVIKEVSRIISSQIRGNDALSRYGGEEFVILLPAAAPEAAISAANRICTAIRLYDLNTEGRLIHLTVSIGVTSMQANENPQIDKLIFNADKALYEAKRIGRDRVCFLTSEK